MTVAMGQLGAVGLGRESAWGTPAAPTCYLEVYAAEVGAQVEVLPVETVRGQRSFRAASAGPLLVGGSMRGPVSPGSIGLVLLGALGAVESSLLAPAAGGDPAVYQHIFTRQTGSELPSFTVEQNLGGIMARQALGCRVSELTLGIPRGGLMSFDLELVGADQGSVSPSAPSFAADELLHHRGLAASRGGVADGSIEEAEVTFGNNLVEGLVTAGSGGRVSVLPAGSFGVRGRLVMLAQSLELAGQYAAGTTFSLVLGVTGERLQGLHWSKLEISLPRVRVTELRAPLAPGRLAYELDFAALAEPATGQEATVTLVNTVASYE